jgi:hypothetical protein
MMTQIIKECFLDKTRGCTKNCVAFAKDQSTTCGALYCFAEVGKLINELKEAVYEVSNAVRQSQ